MEKWLDFFDKAGKILLGLAMLILLALGLLKVVIPEAVEVKHKIFAAPQQSPVNAEN